MTDAPLVDVLADVIGRAIVLRTPPADIATAVVMTCQDGLSVAQQAELVKGEVERQSNVMVARGRVVGPWRSMPMNDKEEDGDGPF